MTECYRCEGRGRHFSIQRDERGLFVEVKCAECKGSGISAESITERQCDILRHALGLKTRAESYRNHFVTDEGSNDYEDCEQLVRLGLMNRRSVDWIPGYIYCVTDAGKNEVMTNAD